MSFTKPSPMTAAKPNRTATAEPVPAARTITARPEPVQLHATRATRLFVAELSAAAPAPIRAANPARSVGRTRKEALRLGDWTATALPFVSTRAVWLFDGEEESVSWAAEWIVAVDIPTNARESAHGELAYNQAIHAAALLVFSAIDAAEKDAAP